MTYRTFIAIELPPPIRRLLKDHIDKLRAQFPDVRASWSREDNLHLTLKFLGDVAVSRISDLSAACEEAAAGTNSFVLQIGGCGTFPPRGKPKVLWIGVSTNDAHPLMLFHAAVEAACAARGFTREARTYHPHLTIARLREAKDSRALAERHRECDLTAQSFQVSEIVLFRSELSSKGSKHTPLSRHRLRDGSKRLDLGTT